MFSDRSYTVVTRATGTKDLCVVNGEDRCPYVGVVTILANVRCQNMCRILTRCFDAVVAAHAVARNSNVIEIGRQPSGRRVTIVTIVAAGNVRRVLAGRGGAVVTRATGAEYLRVVDSNCWFPDSLAVAVLAYIGGLNMCGTLTRGINTVVTVDAIADDIEVIEVGRQPGDGRMTVIAIIAACDMCQVFPDRCNAVVTGSARAQHLRVVDRIDRRPEG